MSGQLKQLGRHTLVYTTGIIIGKVASFVMLPVYTRYLTPADYGVLELLEMTIDVIGMVAGAGIVAGVFKFYYAEDDPAARQSIISTAALGVVALALVTSLAGLAFAPQLSTLILGAKANPLYLRLYFLLYFLQILEYVPFLLIRAENRSVLFVAVNSAKLMVMLSLNILFVVYFRMGIVGVLESSIIASAFVGIGLTWYLFRRVGIEFSKEKYQQMLKFGTPVIPWWLANFVLVFSDRYFLNYYVDTASVGIYSLAYKFAFLMSALAYSPFETVWTSQRFEIAKRPDARELYARVFLYMNVMLGVIGLGLSLFVRDVLSVMSSPAFLPASRVVPLLIAAQVVFTWAGYWTLGIYITGRTKVMSIGALVLVPITLILNYLLIPRFGMFGAAMATLFAYSARFVWIYHSAQRQYRIPYGWSEMAKLYAILGAAVALGLAYHPEFRLASISWNASLFLASIGLVYALILSSEDRAMLAALIRGSLPAVLRRRAPNAV